MAFSEKDVPRFTKKFDALHAELQRLLKAKDRDWPVIAAAALEVREGMELLEKHAEARAKQAKK